MANRKPRREIPELDKLIDTTIAQVMGKSAYAQLVDDLVLSPINQTWDQAKMVRGLEALKACQRNGAAKCFTANPTAICEMMTIGTSNSDAITPSDYPDLTPGQRILLREFNKEWGKLAKPLLAERIQQFDRRKLTAEGLQRTVREWFDTNRHGFHNFITARHSLLPVASLVMMLQGSNCDPVCGEYLTKLMNMISKRNFTVTQRLLDSYMGKISGHFTVDPQWINDNTVHSIKRDLDNINDYAMGMESEAAMHDLRNRFWELVEMPFIETNNVLRRGSRRK